MPDGATVDAEGYLWSAAGVFWRITPFRPRTERSIELCRFPSGTSLSLAFGGPNLDIIYFTSIGQIHLPGLPKRWAAGRQSFCDYRPRHQRRSRASFRRMSASSRLHDADGARREERLARRA